MNINSLTYSTYLFRLAAPVRHFPLPKLPHISILTSLFLLALGLCIPAFMLLEIFPASLLLGFLGIGLMAAGGIGLLVFCGEIL